MSETHPFKGFCGAWDLRPMTQTRDSHKAKYRPDAMAESWDPERSHLCLIGLEKHQKKIAERSVG